MNEQHEVDCSETEETGRRQKKPTTGRTLHQFEHQTNNALGDKHNPSETNSCVQVQANTYRHVLCATDAWHSKRHALEHEKHYHEVPHNLEHE